MSSNVIANENKIVEQTSAKKTTAKDRVCGMEVQKDKALRLEHNGKKYFFCSKKCEEIFKKEPSVYERNTKKEPK